MVVANRDEVVAAFKAAGPAPGMHGGGSSKLCNLKPVSGPRCVAGGQLDVAIGGVLRLGSASNALVHALRFALYYIGASF